MTRPYRLAALGPWPPLRSGVADYAALVLPALAERFDLTVFTDEPAPLRPAGVAVEPMAWFASAVDQDCVLYQIGNDIRLGPVYRAALARPGVVILHDPVLHPLVSELTWGKGDRAGFWREVAYEAGAAPATRLVEQRAGGATYAVADYPLSARLVDSSLVTLVHSHHAAKLLRRASPEADVRVIPHAAFPRPGCSKAVARRRLGVPDNAFYVGVFGFATAEKRFHVLLPAFRLLRAALPAARLVVVGSETASCPIEKMVRARGMDRIVELTGWVDEATLDLYLAAVDVSVHLRWPTLGETSGSVVRALAAGQPLVVSDAGWFAELPDDVAIKVPVGPGEDRALAAALTRLAQDPELAVAMGRAAAAYARTELDAWQAVRRIEAAIVDAIAGRAAPPAPGGSQARELAHFTRGEAQ